MVDITAIPPVILREGAIAINNISSILAPIAVIYNISK
jgi:tRNA A37 threonylcarbamoyladenosine synthetase subunit TsaC/SUA5/YrdC